MGRHCCTELLAADVNGLFLSGVLPADKSLFPYSTSCLLGNGLSVALEFANWKSANVLGGGGAGVTGGSRSPPGSGTRPAKGF